MKKTILSILVIFVVVALLSFGVSARSGREGGILGKKAKARNISGTVTLNQTDFGKFITVDTSGGVAEISLPSPSPSTKNHWMGIMRDGTSGVSLIVITGSIDLPGATGTRLYNHPSNESGSNVMLIWGGVSGESVFAVDLSGTWGLK